MNVRWLLGSVGWSLALLAACSVYDESLLEGGSSPGTTQASSGSPAGPGGAGPGGGGPGGGGQGGATTGTAGAGGGCGVPADCGDDTECQTWACNAGTCAAQNVPQGVALAAQAEGDCLEAQCDGAGEVQQVPVADPFDDGMDCTADTCDQGAPVNDPEPEGTSCSEGGGSFCNADQTCVECIEDFDCVNLICDDAFQCAPAQCGDGIDNGTETDVDCGGPSCSPCPTGDGCILGSDCVGGTCTTLVCAANCADTAENNQETDVDCGGPTCGPCDVGQGCSVGGDCVSDLCQGQVCRPRLLISEVQTRGDGGGNDEFLEIYNPTGADIVLDAQWTLEVSSAAGAANYIVRWTGAGLVIPAQGHFLIAQSGSYNGSQALDADLNSGISDASAVRLRFGGQTVDAVCFHHLAAQLTTLTTQANSFECEGTPVSNLPHNDGTAGMSNTDVSIDRKPGGAAGNGVDTNDNNQDFTSNTPSNPQNRNSAPTP